MKPAPFDFARAAYPYRELPRERFDDVVRMLSEGVANRWGRGSAYLHRDGVHHTLKARRGARLAAITSGGTIEVTRLSGRPAHASAPRVQIRASAMVTNGITTPASERKAHSRTNPAATKMSGIARDRSDSTA